MRPSQISRVLCQALLMGGGLQNVGRGIMIFGMGSKIEALSKRLNPFSRRASKRGFPPQFEVLFKGGSL